MKEDTPNTLSVSELTKRIKTLLEQEIGTVWVSGEISNWTVAASGHAYFTLKDEFSQLDAVMFKGNRTRLRFTPENGIEVLVHGEVTVYERRGSYQIIVREMHPRGLGALQLAYEKLKQKLAAEGLFDERHKKKLPLLPRHIGIVTSPTGAAIRDILQVLRRRFANVHITLYPVRVQGEGAAEEIVTGLNTLDRYGVEVIIVGRGGGSLEDLWAFNEELVARAIFAATTPIISAVGHEIDFTLADFVADCRAPTPSAAAEIVVRDQQTIMELLENRQHRLKRSMQRIFEQLRARHSRLVGSYVFSRAGELFRQERQLLDELRIRIGKSVVEAIKGQRETLIKNQRALTLLSPRRKIEQQRLKLDSLHQHLQQSSTRVTERFWGRFSPLLAKLDSLSPLAVLARGYALAFKLPESRIIYKACEVSPGNTLQIWVGSGEINATVVSINPSGGINTYELREKKHD